MKNTLTIVVLFSFLLSTPAQADEQPRGKVLAFFATWCVPCRVEIPHLERLHRTYHEAGIEVVLVSVDSPSSAAEIAPFLARFDVSAPWIHDSETALLERYHPPANVPFTVILDRAGAVVYQHAGYEPGDEVALETAVVDLLEGTVESGSLERREVRTSVVLQTLGMWRSDRFDPVLDGELRAAVGRLEATVDTGDVRSGVRADGVLLNVPSGVDADDVRLERAWFDITGEYGHARLGDTYAGIGHGVSLSLRKVDPLGLDTTLRGGQVDVDMGRVSVRGIGGVINPQNLDPIEMGLVEDVSDRVFGAETMVDVGEVGALGPYALFVHAPGAAPDGEDVDWRLAGVTGDLDFGALRWGFEGALGDRVGKALEDETAWAAYSSVGVDLGPTSTLLEGKFYRHWAIGREERSLAYHEPPTLERADQQVPDNEDALGGRARIEWRIGDDTTIYANALATLFTTNGDDPLEAGELAWHGFVGGERRLGADLSMAVSTGVREETNAEGQRRLALWHADFDVSWMLTSAVSTTLKWNHVSETKTLFTGPDEFVRGLGVAGFSWRGWGVFSLLYGYSTEVATRPVHYPGAEVRVFLPNGGDVRLFGGRLVGGRLCVSGSCRDVPPFEGVRGDVVVRF